jgi:SSS family solute:Na+ symporter
MERSHLHAVDIAVIATYLLATLGMGAYFMRRQRSSSEFLLASHDIGWFAIGLSLLASLNSALDYIVGPASYIQWGLVLATSFIGIAFAFPIVLRVFIPFYLRLRIFNCYEYLELRFDSRVRTTVSVIFIVWRICWMAFTIYLPAYALNVVIHIPMIPTIVVLGAITTIYTTMGGVRASVWIDVVQAVIMFSGLVLAICIAVSETPGGLTGVFETARSANLMRFTPDIPQWNSATLQQKISLYFHWPITLVSVVTSTFIWQLTNYGSDQVMIQRYLSAKSIRDCKQGFITNAILYVIYVGLFFTLSMSLLAYFVHHPVDFGPEVGERRFAMYFPYFIGTKLPVAIKGIVLASIYAAAQSSASAGITAVTSVLYAEFYRTPDSPVTTAQTRQRRERRHMIFNRVCIVSFGIVVTIMACFIDGMGQSLFGLANKIVSNFAGVMIPVFLLGMFSRRARSMGVMLGAVCGLIAMFVWGFGDRWGLFEQELGYGWTTLVGFIVTIAVCLAVSAFELPLPREKLDYLWENVMKREVAGPRSLVRRD